MEEIHSTEREVNIICSQLEKSDRTKCDIARWFPTSIDAVASAIADTKRNHWESNDDSESNYIDYIYYQIGLLMS